MRDRLHEFNQAISKKASSTRSRAVEGQDANLLENESARYVKDFLIKVEEVHKMFSKIDQIIEDTVELQSTLQEFGEMDEKLFTLYENIRKSFQKLANKITDLEKSFDVSKFKGSNTELRICCTQLIVSMLCTSVCLKEGIDVSTGDGRWEAALPRKQVLTLKQKLTSSVSNYYNIQEEYKEQCKARVKRQAEISGADVSVIDFDEAVENKTDFFVQAVFPDYNVARYYLSEIKKRHKDFLRLEKSILQLRDLIFGLHMVLIEDTALINRIDKHVYAVLDYVMEAAEQIEDYQNLQKARRNKYYCFCCIGIVVFLIIIALFAAFI